MDFLLSTPSSSHNYTLLFLPFSSSSLFPSSFPSHRLSHTFLTPTHTHTNMRGSTEEGRMAHNHEVGGSKPPLATHSFLPGHHFKPHFSTSPIYIIMIFTRPSFCFSSEEIKIIRLLPHLFIVLRLSFTTRMCHTFEIFPSFETSLQLTRQHSANIFPTINSNSDSTSAKPHDDYQVSL